MGSYSKICRNPENKDPVEFEIAPGVFVGDNRPVFIIGDIGQNHQGNYLKARRLIRIAADCGVHCVAFQKCDLQSRYTQEALNRPYEKEHALGATYGEHMRALELSNENFVKLKQYAEELGLIFTATGMDQPSIDFLQHIGVPFFKIDSADSTNLPLLRHVRRYNKPLVISTGITREEDLAKAYYEILWSAKNIAIMQSTSCYPTPSRYANLKVIKGYKNLFPRAVIGYSGHEEGLVESVAAVAIGAKIIERRITTGHSRKQSNHVSSLNPHELEHFVESIKRVEQAMGKFQKEIEVCELDCYTKLGKTIVAKRFLAKGIYISAEDLDVKSSVEKEFHPLRFCELIGRRLKKAVKRDVPLMSSDFH
ncbi:Sialic acid synthase like protein [Argiope bruennichi]|uniref:Sialic acid synthase like protein n=1 Tax=Argiope bruennichi TaxID=94029 RepID=A0A8T0F0G7_ARGBR|nr:Sialic acid synthase like protein [Argiope bruennichi]